MLKKEKHWWCTSNREAWRTQFLRRREEAGIEGPGTEGFPEKPVRLQDQQGGRSSGADAGRGRGGGCARRGHVFSPVSWASECDQCRSCLVSDGSESL